jgi:hypothetical protein
MKTNPIFEEILQDLEVQLNSSGSSPQSVTVLGRHFDARIAQLSTTCGTYITQLYRLKSTSRQDKQLEQALNQMMLKEGIEKLCSQGASSIASQSALHYLKPTIQSVLGMFADGKIRMNAKTMMKAAPLISSLTSGSSPIPFVIIHEDGQKEKVNFSMPEMVTLALKDKATLFAAVSDFIPSGDDDDNIPFEQSQNKPDLSIIKM